MDKLVERLRLKAATASKIARQMAEDKSLRQDGNTEGRTDLYMWPTPEQTIEGQAADALAIAQKRVNELEAALKLCHSRLTAHPDRTTLDIQALEAARAALRQAQSTDVGGEG